MTDAIWWWGQYGWPVHELLWSAVAIVGLVVAVWRWRRGQPVARWAVGAFAVMLFPFSYFVALALLGKFGVAGHEWADVWQKRLGEIAIVAQLMRAAGFALLVPALFAGRQPIPSHDPDTD